jgi:YVTN family beta-propeller protein
MKKIIFFLLLLFTAAGAQAQLVATLAVPGGGGEVAVNPSTNRIYVVDSSANALDVIDGATNGVVQVPVGRDPRSLAVNASTNRIYVSNAGDGTLSVVDGSSNAVITLPIGGSGSITVDERSNRIYVIREGDPGDVTIVDGPTNTWHSIATGSRGPVRAVVNPDTNRLYVSYRTSGDVRVVDASSASDQPPSVSIAVAGAPAFLALNRATNKVYASTNDTRDPVVEIDGASNAAIPITMAGHAPFAVDLAVNAATNRIYLSLQDEVAVVDGATRAVSYIPTGFVGRLAVDEAFNRVYATGGSSVIVIDGATQSFTRIPLPTVVSAIAVNPATHRVYATGVGTAVLEGNAIGTVAPNYGINLQGIWWNSPAGSESGWGLYIAHQGNTVFAVWFTYDLDGKPMWLVVPNAGRRTDREYRGDVYRVTGPPFNAATFDPASVHATLVGNVTIGLDALRDDLLFMSGTILGTFVNKTMTREIYAAPVPTCTAGGTPGALPNYQDMWWQPSESGWGLSVAHQGDIIFAVLYFYDESGRDLWVVAPNVPRTGNATYSGALYRTQGPPFSRTFWNNSEVGVVPVGNLSLAFSDANNATLTYTYAGVTRTKSITREAFSSPATTCR